MSVNMNIVGIKHKLKSIKRPLLIRGGWLVLFATVGVSALLATKAVTPYVSIEPETATLANSATSTQDAQASGGGYITFM
jgi:hypothetical protein